MSALCILFFILSIALPVLFIRTLYKNFYHLKRAEYKEKYYAFYEELRLKTGRKTLMMPSFFLLRRLLLGLAIILVKETLSM